MISPAFPSVTHLLLGFQLPLIVSECILNTGSVHHDHLRPIWYGTCIEIHTCGGQTGIDDFGGTVQAIERLNRDR